MGLKALNITIVFELCNEVFVQRLFIFGLYSAYHYAVKHQASSVYGTQISTNFIDNMAQQQPQQARPWSPDFKHGDRER